MFAKTLRISSPWKVVQNLRFQSTAGVQDQLVNTNINEKTGIATLTMNSKPVNSLSLKFLKKFCEQMDLLEKEKVKGMILTSSVKNVFSSGLDFNELIKPEESEINAFWLYFQESWIKLYGSSFPTVALINGHAPAGGCVYALSCEYRVMLPNLTIGLNELPVGIIPPKFIMEMARQTISIRKAELMLTTGTLYSSEDALEIGLIDELAPNQDDAVERSETFLKKYSKIPPIARTFTKLEFRRECLDLLKNPIKRSQDAKIFIDHILRPSTQNDMGSYIANLKKSKK